MSDASLSPQKFDIEKQERVVTALWEFARLQQTREHNCTSGDGTSVNLDAVGYALGRILGIFGLTKADIQ